MNITLKYKKKKKKKKKGKNNGLSKRARDCKMFNVSKPWFTSVILIDQIKCRELEITV
jgi:hypothetical protein